MSAEVPNDGVAFPGEVTVGFGAASRIAGYRLEQRIGAGGMAVVFRARDERLGRLVALKILAPGLAADDEFRQRFVRESRAAAIVDDPHIIPVFEAGEAEGVLFIAMRYVPGGDVRSLLRQASPPGPPRRRGNRRCRRSGGNHRAPAAGIPAAPDREHREQCEHRDQCRFQPRSGKRLYHCQLQFGQRLECPDPRAGQGGAER